MPGMSDALLPIGPFSTASLLSVKTLRAYHEAGILVPPRSIPDRAIARTTSASSRTPA